jgi:hypothetical protein
MELSDDRMDYFVSIKVGDREVTPHVFREEYKAAYHVALYDWLLNGTGEEPDCVEFGPKDWPARVMSTRPDTAEARLREALAWCISEIELRKSAFPPDAEKKKRFDEIKALSTGDEAKESEGGE